MFSYTSSWPLTECVFKLFASNNLIKTSLLILSSDYIENLRLLIFPFSRFLQYKLFFIIFKWASKKLKTYDDDYCMMELTRNIWKLIFHWALMFRWIYVYWMAKCFCSTNNVSTLPRKHRTNVTLLSINAIYNVQHFIQYLG